MIYIPLLPNFMDYPDILGMRVPLPSLVLATDNDPLFTLEEVENAGKSLQRSMPRPMPPKRSNFHCTKVRIALIFPCSKKLLRGLRDGWRSKKL